MAESEKKLFKIGFTEIPGSDGKRLAKVEAFTEEEVDMMEDAGVTAPIYTRDELTLIGSGDPDEGTMRVIRHIESGAYFGDAVKGLKPLEDMILVHLSEYAVGINIEESVVEDSEEFPLFEPSPQSPQRPN